MKKTTLFARLNIYHLLNYGILSVLMICVFFMFLKSNQKSILIRLTEEKLQVLEHEIGRGSFEGECPSFDNKGILQPDLPESEFWLVFSTDYTLLYQSANFNELDKPDAFLEHLFQSLRTAPDSLSGSYSVLFPEKGRAFLAVTCNPASHLCFCYLIFPGQSKGYETRNPTSFLLISLLFILLGGGIIGLINSFISRPYKRLSALIGEKEGKSSEVQFEGNEVHFLAKVYEKHKNQIGMLEEIIQKTSERNIQLENDLKLAKKLQRNLLPAITPAFTNRKEFSLYALSESAFDIGGDLYDYFMIDNDRLLVAVGDVAGKGITASLYMIYTHTLLRTISTSQLSVSDIIEKLNNKLIDENISDMFVTFFMGILNLRTGEFTYCNAAHNVPLMVHSEGRIDELTEMHGIPIGIYGNRNYSSSCIQLKKGDQVFIYSDGLTDASDESGMKFSLDVLKYNLMGAWFDQPRDVVLKIKYSIEQFRKGKKPDDDLTLLCLQFLNETD